MQHAKGRRGGRIAGAGPEWLNVRDDGARWPAAYGGEERIAGILRTVG